MQKIRELRQRILESMSDAELAAVVIQGILRTHPEVARHLAESFKYSDSGWQGTTTNVCLMTVSNIVSLMQPGSGADGELQPSTPRKIKRRKRPP